MTGHAIFCHAFDNRCLHFVNRRETMMMVDRLLQSTPDGKLTGFKSGLFGGQNVWLSELKVLMLQVSMFLVVCEAAREHRPAAVIICIKHKKLTSLQHRVRATKSHIQNSTNHFSGIM